METPSSYAFPTTECSWRDLYLYHREKGDGRDVEGEGGEKDHELKRKIFPCPMLVAVTAVYRKGTESVVGFESGSWGVMIQGVSDNKPKVRPLACPDFPA